MSYGPEKLIPSKDLRECAICARYFTLDRVNVHEGFCKSSYMTKRKSFDISRQRLRGTEAERLSQTSAQDSLTSHQRSHSSGLSTNWRGKNEDFLKKIKEAKDQINGRNKERSSLPYPPSVDHKIDYVQCQNCLRKFNKNFASQHIATCTNKMQKSFTKFTNE